MEKLLLVDDFFNTRLLFKELLTHNGYDVLVADNGKQAIDVIENEKISVVIMDIEMPVMNGIETTKYIRRKLQMNKEELPIIALSAHCVNDVKKRYLSVGFNEFVSKPVNISDLLLVLNKLIK